MINRSIRRVSLIIAPMILIVCMVWAMSPTPYAQQPGQPQRYHYNVAPPSNPYPSPQYRHQTYVPSPQGAIPQQYQQPRPPIRKLPRQNQFYNPYNQGRHTQVAPNLGAPGVKYAFRPSLNNYEYAQCLALEREFQKLWMQYRDEYMRTMMMGRRDPKYVSMTYYLQNMKKRLDGLWNNFSASCIYYPSQTHR